MVKSIMSTQNAKLLYKYLPIYVLHIALCVFLQILYK